MTESPSAPSWTNQSSEDITRPQSHQQGVLTEKSTGNCQWSFDSQSLSIIALTHVASFPRSTSVILSFLESWEKLNTLPWCWHMLNERDWQGKSPTFLIRGRRKHKVFL